MLTACSSATVPTEFIVWRETLEQKLLTAQCQTADRNCEVYVMSSLKL